MTSDKAPESAVEREEARRHPHPAGRNSALAVVPGRVAAICFGTAVLLAACARPASPPPPAPVIVTPAVVAGAPVEPEESSVFSTPSPLDAPLRVSAAVRLGLARLAAAAGDTDLKEAGRLLLAAHRRGDPQAATAVAFCHLQGCYGAPDAAAITAWINGSQRREPAKALLLQALAARRFDTGGGWQRSRRLIREAAGLGDAVALNDEGVRLLGVGQRYQAVAMLRRAAARGSQAAAANLAQLAPPTAGALPAGRFAVAPAATVPVSSRSGASDAARREYALGLRFHFGDGVPVNVTEAEAHYRRASDLGNADAARMLQVLTAAPRARSGAVLATRASDIKPGRVYVSDRAGPPRAWDAELPPLGLRRDASPLADWSTQAN